MLQTRPAKFKKLRFLFSSLTIFALANLYASVNFAAPKNLPESVTIGFTPGDNPDLLKKSGVELAKDLQEKLGVPVNIYISKDYTSLTEAMLSKKIDFAFFSAVTFVEAEKKAGAKVLLKKVWEGPFYYAAIVTKKNSGIKKLEDLKGKRFGYVDEKSASGHYYPRVILFKKGLNPDHLFSKEEFFGHHEATVKALFDGKVDAIGTFSNNAKGSSGAWDKYGTPEQAKQIRVLTVSGAIPSDPFCVRNDFYESYPHLTHDLMFALIDYNDQPDDKNLLKKLYGIKSMELATSRQYDPVRELVQYLDSKK